MTFKPEWIIGHCSATNPSQTFVDAKWINMVHRKKGWLMSGYHEIITRPHEGQSEMRQNHSLGYPMRPITRPGAHVGGCGPGWNKKTIGVCMAGGVDQNNVPEDNFTPRQYDLFLEAIREYQEMFDIPDERVIGHRDLIKMTNASPKACPCMSVQAFLTKNPELRYGGDFVYDRPSFPSALTVPATHRVRRGESLWGISKSYGVSIALLQEWNGISNDAHIRSGSVLSLRKPKLTGMKP